MRKKEPFSNFSYGPFLWVAIHKNLKLSDIREIRKQLTTLGFKPMDRYKGIYKAHRSSDRQYGLEMLRTAMQTTLKSDRVREDS